jgi:hypothetical protein
MKQNLTPHRRAAALLLAAAALPLTPLAAQDVPTVNAPPPTAAPAPAPAPAPTQAPTAAPVMGPSSAVRGPIVEHVAPAATASATRAAPAPRPPARTARAAAPARQIAAAPERAAPAPAPAPTAVTAGATPAVAPVPAAPVAAEPAAPTAAPTPVPVETATTEAPANGVAPWQWMLAIGAIAIIALGAVLLIARRRRRAEEVYYDEAAYEEPAYEAPLAEAEPAVIPVAAAADEVSLGQSDRADVDALAASSEPAPNRPWLEFLMRPVRAGTSEDETRVEFELTVGNTGSVPARDVQISTWMVAGGEGTDMERSLIDPPADATRSEMSIAPGDGARVDGAMSLPTRRVNGSVLPVVVADARYRLPDGSEGRTHASFAVGLPSGDGLAPFASDSGLRDDVEARLHGEPERV